MFFVPTISTLALDIGMITGSEIHSLGNSGTDFRVRGGGFHVYKFI